MGHRFAFLKIALGLLLLAIALLSPMQARAATSPAVRVPALSWSDCGSGFQCATATVPLDYDRPQDGTISLALIRLPATDQAHRIGSLFTNPGGPGNSGVNLIRGAGKTFPAAIRARFDLIGFDPRGVGASTPVRCFDSGAAQLAFFSKYGLFPVGAKEEQAYRQAYRQFDQQCAQRNARLLPHLSTASVARDLDLLRQAVGDEKLSYFGISYGTYLGATYANLFPNRFRALILDGVLDPIDYSTGRDDQAEELNSWLRVGSNVGTFQTLHAFLDQCTAAGTSHCAFAADSVKDTAEKFDALLHRVLKQPIVVQASQGPITFTYALTVYTVLYSLYGSHGWPQLAALLQLLFQLSGLPAPDVLAQAPQYQNRREVQLANLCVDTANPASQLAYPAIAHEADERSPYFGAAWTYVSFPCAGWPAQDRARYVGPWDRETASPILLVGTTTDPATPYHNAVSTSHELANARLLTLDGWGHSAFLQGSTCIDQYETAYLIDGTLPTPQTTCSPDSPPFGQANQAAIPVVSPEAPSASLHRRKIGYFIVSTYSPCKPVIPPCLLQPLLPGLCKIGNTPEPDPHKGGHYIPAEADVEM
jgi:pimeloyl-ACP methyl ester carboxylesterase